MISKKKKRRYSNYSMIAVLILSVVITTTAFDAGLWLAGAIWTLVTLAWVGVVLDSMR